MRVLLDENLDVRLKSLFDPAFQVATVRDRRWQGVKNGALLRDASTEFEVLVTMDKKLSLAIAHDLEDVFWYEDEDGKWQPREVEASTVAELIAERTSTAVKEALESLLRASAPVGGRKGRTGSKRRK